eukprot:s1465_g7.t1
MDPIFLPGELLFRAQFSAPTSHQGDGLGICQGEHQFGLQSWMRHRRKCKGRRSHVKRGFRPPRTICRNPPFRIRFQSVCAAPGEMRCGAKQPTSEASSLTRLELKQEIQDQLADFRRKLLEDFSAQLQNALTSTQLPSPLPRPSPSRLQVPQATVVRPPAVRHYASDGEEELTEVTKKGFRKNIETEFQNAMDGIIKSQSRSRSRTSRTSEEDSKRPSGLHGFTSMRRDPSTYLQIDEERPFVASLSEQPRQLCCARVGEEEVWFKGDSCSSKLRNLVESDGFGYFITSLVLVNAVVIGIETDFAARNGGTGRLPFSHFISTTFCYIFTAEVIMRLYVHGLAEFFCGNDWRWNIFDFLVVGLQWFEQAVDLLFMAFGGHRNGTVMNFGFLRILRTLRVNGARPTGRSHEAAKPRSRSAPATPRSRGSREAAKPQRPGEAAKPRSREAAAPRGSREAAEAAKPRSRSAPGKPRSRGSRGAAKPQRPGEAAKPRKPRSREAAARRGSREAAEAAKPRSRDAQGKPRSRGSREAARPQAAKRQEPIPPTLLVASLSRTAWSLRNVFAAMEDFGRCGFGAVVVETFSEALFLPLLTWRKIRRLLELSQQIRTALQAMAVVHVMQLCMAKQRLFQRVHDELGCRMQRGPRALSVLERHHCWVSPAICVHRGRNAAKQPRLCWHAGVWRVADRAAALKPMDFDDDIPPKDCEAHYAFVGAFVGTGNMEGTLVLQAWREKWWEDGAWFARQFKLPVGGFLRAFEDEEFGTHG